MGGIELVVTDLDGTLWDRPGEIHAETLAAWHELERRGVAVIVATGRRVTSTREPLAECGLAPPAVVMNGAIGVDLATGARFHEYVYDPATRREVLRIFLSFDLEPCVYVDDTDIEVCIGANPSTHPNHLRFLGARAVTRDLDEVVANERVFMFGTMGHELDRLAPLATALSPMAIAHAQGDFLSGSSFTVIPRGLSKWAGVVAYCEHAGLDRARVLAIGDGPNDVELLTQAAIAVVPEPAHADAVAVADHVATGGWGDIVDLV